MRFGGLNKINERNDGLNGYGKYNNKGLKSQLLVMIFQLVVIPLVTKAINKKLSGKK